MGQVREVGVRGGRIELEVHGNGPPLILLHGWAMDRRIWAPQIDALAARFQLILPDRRGFGRSTAPPDLAMEADDLTVIRRALGLDQVALLAMSQAGRVALQFALAHPESVWALVLQGVPLDGFHPEERSSEAVPLDSYRALARTGNLQQMKALWRSHPLMRMSAAEVPELDALLDAYDGRDLAAGTHHSLDSIAERLADIWSPALVVTGEHDTRWRKLVGDALAYGLGDAQRATIPGAHHLCNVSHAGEFNRLVASFLSRVQERSKLAAAGTAA
jgi:pimeloyl-ACP methyl ester carboxylesterase